MATLEVTLMKPTGYKTKYITLINLQPTTTMNEILGQLSDIYKIDKMYISLGLPMRPVSAAEPAAVGFFRTRHINMNTTLSDINYDPRTSNSRGFPTIYINQQLAEDKDRRRDRDHLLGAQSHRIQKEPSRAALQMPDSPRGSDPGHLHPIPTQETIWKNMELSRQHSIGGGRKRRKRKSKKRKSKTKRRSKRRSKRV